MLIDHGRPATVFCYSFDDVVVERDNVRVLKREQVRTLEPGVRLVGLSDRTPWTSGRKAGAL
jgi:hypothetical protein